MTTYQVTLDNQETITRNSKLAFTHAVIANVFRGGEFKHQEVWAFASSKELAEKRAASFASKTKSNSFAGSTYKVVEVEVSA